VVEPIDIRGKRERERERESIFVGSSSSTPFWRAIFFKEASNFLPATF
jgi:hypothetical protein